jgi:hypothetical protein
VAPAATTTCVCFSSKLIISSTIEDTCFAGCGRAHIMSETRSLPCTVFNRTGGGIIETVLYGPEFRMMHQCEIIMGGGGSAQQTHTYTRTHTQDSQSANLTLPDQPNP